MLKIHPPTQGVDLSDQRYTPFFRRCADLKIMVMVHTGHEHTAPIVDANCYVEYHQVHSFAIESAGRETLDLDGEIKGTAPVDVRMLPAALDVFA